jgi:hypothetical protein
MRGWVSCNTHVRGTPRSLGSVRAMSTGSTDPGAKPDIGQAYMLVVVTAAFAIVNCCPCAWFSGESADVGASRSHRNHAPREHSDVRVKFPMTQLRRLRKFLQNVGPHARARTLRCRATLRARQISPRRCPWVACSVPQSMQRPSAERRSRKALIASFVRILQSRQYFTPSSAGSPHRQITSAP